ncbi:hypothetical protein J4464_03135 [Candidatus Woesearchaeota archaeon]|nr:hypothetical protein [Candidatus Woesearchaeota archaeon]
MDLRHALAEWLLNAANLQYRAGLHADAIEAVAFAYGLVHHDLAGEHIERAVLLSHVLHEAAGLPPAHAHMALAEGCVRAEHLWKNPGLIAQIPLSPKTYLSYPLQ